MTHYKGTVAKSLSSKPGKPCGFIVLSSITQIDGSAHGLDTAKDIFVHQDDCAMPLRSGMELVFSLAYDERRGNNTFRATDVSAQVHDLAVVSARIGGALVDPRSLYVAPTPAQANSKTMSSDSLDVALANRPMATISREIEETVTSREFANKLLRNAMPQFANMDPKVTSDVAGDTFEKKIDQAISDHKALGMQAQAIEMKRGADQYIGLRKLFVEEGDFLTPASILPIQYLPDLFMAVPVWYFWSSESSRKDIEKGRAGDDPQVDDRIAYFCDLFPGQPWTDTFLMFNRRMRTLADYTGDIIPTSIIARMRDLAPKFDALVIMTPYHDVAGADWQDLNWLRHIDPYVVGFIKGMPHMFVIGRFSDSGIFPLYTEMLADTIDFLRMNKGRLEGFNAVSSPWWRKDQSRKRSNSVRNLGTVLQKHTDQLIVKYEEGDLFTWLRGEEALLASK